MGRPSSYRPEFAKQVKKLCELGATDPDIADFFEVSIRTVERWKSEHAEFCRALKENKEVANQRVERSLYQRANGYTFDSVKIFPPTAHRPDLLEVPYREHVPPDTTACIFWLKNRKPEEWRDRQEHVGKDGGPLAHSIEVSFVSPKAATD
jgi:hypothetical protein